MKALLLFIVLIQIVVNQLSSPPKWIGNPYLETNKYQVITNFDDTSQTGGANITFMQTYRIPPKVAFAITTYSGNDGLYDEDFYMRTVRVTTTLVEVNVFMTGITNIRIFYVMYLAVHPDFKYHLNTFNDIEANYSTTSLSLNPIDTYNGNIRTFVNYINYTELCSKITTDFKYFGTDMSKNKIAAYLSGIFNYVQGGLTPQVKFDITTQAVNTSFFKLQVQVLPYYRVDLLKLSFIAMDIANIETSKEYTIVFKSERYYFDKDYYIPLEKQFFNDVFIGMADYNTQSPRCTIDYQLVFEPDNARIVVKKSQPHPLAGGYLYGGLKSARLVLFYMKTWYCPVPYYYFNLATDLCDDACAAYLYGNQTAGQCKPCPTGCFSCDSSNPDMCTVCDATVDFRQLVNGTCECMKGYFQRYPSDVSCSGCTGVIDKCASCQIISNNVQCNQCLEGWYLQSSSSCKPCTMTGCLSCTSPTQCIKCDLASNYTLYKDKTCQQCPIACSCDGYYLPVLYFSNGDQYCSTVCGDGLKRELEQCDDGNGEDNDGCDSTCKIQKFWTCQSEEEKLTCCKIKEQEMFIKVDDISKTKGQNSFEIHLSLYPHLSFLSSQKLKSSLNISLSGISTTKSQVQTSQTQKISLKYYYDEHVEKRQCLITLKISLSQNGNQNCSMSVQTSMEFYPDSSNYLPMLFFSQQTYLAEEKADFIAEIIMYASYGVLALSAIPCKIVGLELFGVLQLAYFSLSQIQDPNLLLFPLIKLGASNGYNPEILNKNQDLPDKIDLIEYDSLFLNNCGFMLGILVLELIIAGLLYAIGLAIPVFLTISKRLLKEGFLTLILFNAFNFAYGSGVHFRYANPNHQMYLVNSICAVLSLAVPVVIMVALAFTDSKQFGQFKNKFKHDKPSQCYFIISLAYRYILGFYIAFKTEQTLTSLLILSVCFIFIIYNFINLPFVSPIHNYRANICHISQLVILLIANYYESMKATTAFEVKAMIFSPAFVQIAVILTSLGVSVLCLFYEIYNFFKNLKSSSNKYKSNKVSNVHSDEMSRHQINQTTQNLNDELSRRTQTINNSSLLIQNSQILKR